MRALHCVNYGDMDPDLKKHLFEEVCRTFTQEGFDLSRFDNIDPEPKMIPVFTVETVVRHVHEPAPRRRFFGLLAPHAGATQ